MIALSIISEKQKEKHKDDLNRGLAQLAGMQGGALLGRTSAIPIDIRYRKKVLKDAIGEIHAKENSVNRWKTLFDLYDKKINIEDLPENDRELFKRLLAEHDEDLRFFASNPAEKQRAINDMIQDANTMPFTRKSLRKMKSPAGRSLAAIGTIGGFIGGQGLYEHFTSDEDL